MKNTYKSLNQLHLEVGNFWSNWTLDTKEGFDFDPDIIGRYIIQNYGTFDYFLPMDYPTDAGEWNFKSSCITWWLRHKDTFQRWYDILTTEYNPLLNEEVTDIDTRTNVHNESGKENGTNVSLDNSTTTNTNTTTGFNNEDSSYTDNLSHHYETNHTITQNLEEKTGTDESNQNNIATFDRHGTVDAPTLTPHDSSTHKANIEKNIYTNDKTNYEEGSIDNDDTKTGSSDTINTYNQNDNSDSVTKADSTQNHTIDTQKESTDTETFTHEHKGLTGVMVSTQDLIKKEIELRKFNLYEQIGDIFADEMCIRVW